MSHRNRASARRSRLLRRRLTLERLESRQMLTGDPTLVAHWTFDENAGTVAHDAAGVDHAAISGGAAWAPGRIGTALKVDAATGGKAVAPDEPALRFVASQSYTLSAWVEADAYAYGWQGVVTKNRDDSNWYGIWILSGQWVAPTPSSMLMGSQVTPGWHHVALVQDGAAGTRSLYVDGASVATGAAQDANGVGGLWVGGAGGVSEFFSGSVDDVRVYSRALSGSELTALANPPVIAPPAAPTGLSAAAASSTAVDLAWTDKAFDESGFKVLRSADGTNFTQVGSVGASATPYQKVTFRDTGLVASRTYYYRVVATNAVGDSAVTNTVSVRTQSVDGLVSEWSFGEGSGTVAHDASGTNDATLLGGAVWTAAGPGVSGAVRFPAGAGGHLVVPDTAALRFGTSQSFTLSAWVSPDLTTSGWQGVVTKARDSAGWYGIWLGDYHWWVGGSDGGNLIATSATAGWHHVAIVQDGAAGTRSFYIDGVSVVSGPAREAGGLGDLWIGGAAGVGEFFTGSIGDVRVYSRALTGAELTGLTVAPASAPTSLTATAVSGTQINLAWADATSNEDGFLVERSTDGVNFAQVARVGPNVTAYADAGRAAGTTYTYRVRAVNVVGYSPYSPTAGATTAAAGDAEGDTLATALPVTLTLGTLYRHQATIGDGLYPNRDVDLYRVELTAGQYLAIQVEARNLDEGGALSNLDTYLRVFNSAGNQVAFNDNAVNPNNGVSSADSALNFTAFTAGTYFIGVSSFASRNYTPTVAGSGSPGTGSESTGDYRLQLRLFATAPPLAPTTVTATSAGSDRVDVVWNNLPNTTGYYVERTPATLNTWQAVATVGANPGVPNITYHDTGLTPGTYYSYRVRAFNDTGASPYSPVVNAWTGPPAPTGLTASTTSATRIVLNWTLSTGNASGYQVEQSVDGVTGWRLIWGVASDATTYQVNGSFNGATTYFFRVRATAFTGAYSSYTPTLAVTTPAFPDPPTLTSAVAQSDTAAALSWADVPRETGFRVERSANGGTTWATAGTVAAGVTTFTDSGLAEGTAYSYRVVATNAVGDSAPGSAKGVTTFPTAPTGLSATAVSATRVDLAWTNRSTAAVYYTIEQSPDGATGWQRVGTVYGPAANRFSAPGPFRGASTYYFRVYANTTAGDHAAATATGSVTTPAFPDPPALTAAVARSDTAVELTWADVPREAGFRIERNANGTWATAGTVAAGVTTFVDTGLRESQSVSYRVVAFNAVGDSAPGVPQDVLTLPAAPTGLTATAVSAGRVDLAWTDVSAVELGYWVEQSSSPDGPWTQVASAGINATSVSVVGAFDGSTPYYFRVRAYTATRTSPAAEASVTTGAWPRTPAQPGATAVSATRIDLAWPAVAGATSYAVERRGYNQANWTPVATVTGGATGYQDAGVSSGTTYVYRVRAANAAGASPYSPEAVVATPALPGVPPGLWATAPGTTWVNLGWGNVADETGYSLERSPNGTTGWAVVATLGANVTSYSDAGLSPGTAYYYRVRATNAAGASGYSATAAATTLAPPAAPTNLAATAASAYQIALSWTASTSSVAYYTVEASSDGVTGWRELGTTGANTTTFTAPGPFGGATTYYFRLRAFHPTTRYSAGSTVLAVTTPAFPLPPITVSAVAASASAVTLTWGAVTGATGYLVERSANGGQTWLSAGTVTGTTFTDHGLQEAQGYSYRVMAHNASGNSFGSRTAGVTTAPAGPTGLVATAVSAGRVDLSWTDQSNGEGGYQIEAMTGGYGVWVPLARVGAGVTSYSAAGPFDGSTIYSFRVYALSAAGKTPYSSSASATAAVTTGAWPATPKNLAANVVSPTQVDLSWGPATGATGYVVERSTNGTSWAVVATRAAGSTSYSDTTPPSNASLFYRVRATNGSGESGNSAAVNPVTRYHTPTVTTTASAKPRVVNGQPDPTPDVVTGRTVDLTVRGDSQEGEGQLLYIWSVVNKPVDAPTPRIPGNGTNAAKDVTATFYAAGTYTFRVTIANGPASATSDVTINVVQSPSSISMTPAVLRITRSLTETTQQFSATVKDQFGQDLRYQPSLSWSTSAGATVDQYGLLKVTPELVGSEVLSVGCATGDLRATATVILPKRETVWDVGLGPDYSSVDDPPRLIPINDRYHNGVRLSTQSGYGVYYHAGALRSGIVASTEPDWSWHTYGVSSRNYPEGFGLGEFYADFALPVNELQFICSNVRFAGGSIPTSATVRVFQNGIHTTDVSVSYAGNVDHGTVDLSAYPGITRIEVTSIVANGGLSISGFSFNQMTAPGVLATVGSGDSDRDGIPDFADGFGIDPTVPDSYYSPGLHFTPVSIAVPDGADINNDFIIISYDAIDPSRVVRSGDKYFPFANGSGYRLWTADGSLPRNMRRLTAGGSFVDPNLPIPLSAFGLGGNDRQITLWLEAVNPSSSVLTWNIKVAFSPSTQSGYDDYASYVIPITNKNVVAPEIEVVTWDPDTGEEEPVGDQIPVSDPRPEVNLHVTDAHFDGNGSLVVTIDWSIVDRLSELADDPAERVQSIKFTVNGQVVSVVNDLSALSGPAELPWRPHPLEVRRTDTLVIPPLPNRANWGGQTLIVRAESSANGVGKIGWDQSSIVVGWRDQSEFSPGEGGNPSGIGAITIGAEPSLETTYYPVIEQIADLEGSRPGSFYPMLVWVSAPNDGSANGLHFAVNGVDQPLASVFGSGKHYVVDRDNRQKPRIFVVTLDNLPPGLSSIKPNNLSIDEFGGMVKFTVTDDNGVTVKDAQVQVLNEDMGLSSTPLQVSSGPLTMPVLLTYFKLLYGEAGLNVLSYYQQGGNLIQLEDLWWIDEPVKLDYQSLSSILLKIRIDQNYDPIAGAQALYRGLEQAMAYPAVRSQIPVDDFDNLKRAYQAQLAEAARIVSTAANIYLNSITIVSEGADWVMTLQDLSEGNYSAAIFLLPFISGRVLKGGKVVINRVDGTKFGEFTKDVLDALSEAAKKSNFADQFAIIESKLNVQQRLEIIKAGIIKVQIRRVKSSKLKQLMIQANIPAPPNFINPQVHHNLPHAFVEWFGAHGIEINDANYMRWVEGTKPGQHQNWTEAFNAEWRAFIAAEDPTGPGYTRQQVLDKMTELANDLTRFP